MYKFDKFRSLLLGLLFLPLSGLAQQGPVPPTLAAKSWLLIESASGQTLAAQTPDERLEPASLTKLMTAYLTFSALHQGKLKLDQPLLISEKAWRTQGSKMFIRVDTQVQVDDLIKGMIVQSGNDACVALAEGIAGSEEIFAQMMNREAERLGMKSSHFRNATGLPDSQHYSTASDLARLAGALIRDFPEEYARYYSIRSFRYNNINQPNRNRLLWLDSSVDGVKTGFTDAAGYCLISSARRDGRRLLSVVLGTKSDSMRAQESLKLLNYGFQAYDMVKLHAANQAALTPRVWKGEVSQVKAGFFNDFAVSVPKGLEKKLSSEFVVTTDKLMAPVEKGQVLATLKLTFDGQPYGEYPVVALEAVAQAGIFGRMVDTVRLWFN